ncbi:MAG: hypothetical protein WA056_07385 [Gallionella sp.]|jgi:hypothetical protein|nr:hypothetical protein [Gallionella sp.]MCK9354107.1 hypothetical protein [Gallionella sp.]
MKTHKRIIGICWIIFGALILSLLALKFDQLLGPAAVAGVLVGLTFLAAGFSLVANMRRSSWICLPCSALSLFTFPIGTVIGAYYLWFYFKVERVS